MALKLLIQAVSIFIVKHLRLKPFEELLCDELYPVLLEPKVAVGYHRVEALEHHVHIDRLGKHVNTIWIFELTTFLA